MNIAVCIKQVPDTETKIKLTADAQWIDTTGVKWIISPYDEYAVEEALRVKEKNPGSTVTVFSAGLTRCQEAIRTALAMGGDSGVQIDIPENADSNTAAKAIAAAIKKEGSFDLIYCGKEAIDDGAAQGAQLIAEYLGVPCVAGVINIEYGDKIKCKREVEGGTLEVIEAEKPLLLAAQKGLNEPRYAKLPDIMKAKKKEIKLMKAADLGVADGDRKIHYKNFQLPPPKQAGKKISGDPAAQAKELVNLLHTEAKVV